MNLNLYNNFCWKIGLIRNYAFHDASCEQLKRVRIKIYSERGLVG